MPLSDPDSVPPPMPEAAAQARRARRFLRWLIGLMLLLNLILLLKALGWLDSAKPDSSPGNRISPTSNRRRQRN